MAAPVYVDIYLWKYEIVMCYNKIKYVIGLAGCALLCLLTTGITFIAFI